MKTLTLITLIFYGLIKLFVIPFDPDFAFEVSTTKVKFHSNWTSSFDRIKQLSELHEALKLP